MQFWFELESLITQIRGRHCDLAEEWAHGGFMEDSWLESDCRRSIMGSFQCHYCQCRFWFWYGISDRGRRRMQGQSRGSSGQSTARIEMDL